MNHIKTLVLFSSILLTSNVFSQFLEKDVSTSTTINSLFVIGDSIFTFGINDYAAVSDDVYTSYTSINSAGDIGYDNYSVNYVDGSFYLISGKHNPDNIYRVYKSADYGQSWQLCLDTTGNSILTLAVIDSLNMIVAGNLGELMVTHDGGGSWGKKSVSSSLMFESSSVYYDSLVVLGAYENILTSIDSGNTWASHNFHQSHPSAYHLFDMDSIYVASYNFNSWEAIFSSSSDGGNNWNSKTISQGSAVYDIYFENKQVGYLVGHDYGTSEGVIFKTLDAGENWEKISTGVNTELVSITYLSAYLYLLTGSNGKLILWDMLTGNFTIQNTEDDIKLYPNPSNGIFQLSDPDKVASYRLYSVDGKLVDSSVVNTNYFDFSRMRGNYFIELIVLNGNSQFKKIVIE